MEKIGSIEVVKAVSGSQTAFFIFHGYGANAFDLSGLQKPLNAKAADWYFPNGVLKLEMGMNYEARAWFPIDMQALQAAIARSEHRTFSSHIPKGFLEICEQLVDWILELCQKNKYQQVVIGGFSQGAMISSYLIPMLLNKSVNVSCGLFFSGNLVGQTQLSELLSNCRQKNVKIFQSHGSFDPVLSSQGASELSGLYNRCGYEVEFHAFAGQHEIPPSILVKCREFLFSSLT